MADKTYTVEIDVDDKNALKSLDSIDEGVKDIGKSTKKTEQATSGLKKGFDGVGLAMKATGIGIVLKLFDAFFDVVKQNQSVMNGLAIAAETVSIFFNDLVTAIVDAFTAVSNATGGFTHMKKVVMNLLNISLFPLKLTFYAIKLAIQEAQLIWEKSFFGDGDVKTIEKLNTAIKQTKQDIVDVGVGLVDSVVAVGQNIDGAISEIGKLGTALIDEVKEVSIVAAYEGAKVNVELQRSAEKATAANRLLIEQYDILAEKQRQIVDDEKKSIDERIAANNRLGEILNEQQKLMSENADALVAYAQAQYDKNSNDENYIALQEALAEQLGVVAQIEGIRSGQMTQQMSLERERMQMINDLTESEVTLALERKKFMAEQELNEVKALELKRSILEEEKLIEAERLQGIIDSYAEGTDLKVQAQIAYNEKMQDLGKQELENERAIQLAKRKMVADSLNAGLGAATAVFGALAEASEGNFERQKKFQIAGAITSTLQGAISAFMGGVETIPGPFGVALGAVLSGVTLASGYANVKKIKNTQPNGGTGGGGSVTAAAPKVSAPSFSMVTPSTNGENKLSEQLSSKTEPQKAYVVSSDMTSQQQLDRSIENKASV